MKIQQCYEICKYNGIKFGPKIPEIGKTESKLVLHLGRTCYIYQHTFLSGKRYKSHMYSNLHFAICSEQYKLNKTRLGCFQLSVTKQTAPTKNLDMVHVCIHVVFLYTLSIYPLKTSDQVTKAARQNRCSDYLHKPQAEDFIHTK